MMVETETTTGVAADSTCRQFTSGQGWRETPACIPAEMALTVFVNQQEMVTILCTPTRLNHLVLGFLYSEGIIGGVRDVASLRVCEDEPIADVRLTDASFKTPARRTLTSGCGSGASFNAPARRVESDLKVTADEILGLMAQMYRRQELFQKCGGVHASALCNHAEIVASAEDIGRHNTLDKILGECLLRKLTTRDGILVTTGRVSSEMVYKAARMQAPIVVSRGSPTERAARLGKELGVTVVGYARGNRLSVFSGEGRVAGASQPA